MTLGLNNAKQRERIVDMEILIRSAESKEARNRDLITGINDLLSPSLPSN